MSISPCHFALFSRGICLYGPMALKVRQEFHCLCAMVHDKLTVTDPNLRCPAVFCEILRSSAVSCALQMLEFSRAEVNLRKSAVLRENLRFGLGLSP